jgi:hypothetical protein
MAIRDEILYRTFIPFLELTEEIAKIIEADRIKFTGGRSYPLLTDISNLKFISREAREFLATQEGVMGIKAAAYVASTQTEKFLWEMFLKINRPPIPSKLFTNKTEAYKWLQQFR